MGAPATKQAVDVTRDLNDAVVSFRHDDPDTGTVEITFTGSVPIEADKLIRDHGWLISPTSGYKDELKLYRSK